MLRTVGWKEAHAFRPVTLHEEIILGKVSTEIENRWTNWTIRSISHTHSIHVWYMGVSWNAGFPQQPWVFLLKMISTWGVKWGETHHLRKHPYLPYLHLHPKLSCFVGKCTVPPMDAMVFWRPFKQDLIKSNFSQDLFLDFKKRIHV